jgi:ribokinase
MGAAIAVVGSLNMDFVVQVQALPRPGETVSGTNFETIPGGKGANQAVAAGRLGGRARMVGRVGDDVFGQKLVESLASAGVDASGVVVTPGTPTGVALIPVESGGQNQIVVAPGANGRLTPDDVARGLRGLAGGLLLLQLESPLDAVERAAHIGREAGASVVLDPAPARELSEALLSNVAYLTPNENEAAALLGRRQEALSLTEAPEAARALRARGPRTVILKLGAQGAYVDDGSGGRHFPAPRVDAVDATAAGDTFNGALAVALAEGRRLPDAVAFANVAAALSVTRRGAQASIPTRPEVDAKLAR